MFMKDRATTGAGFRVRASAHPFARAPASGVRLSVRSRGLQGAGGSLTAPRS